MSSISEFRPGRFRVVHYQNGKRTDLYRNEKHEILLSSKQAEDLMKYLSEFGYDPRVFGKTKIPTLNYSDLTEMDKEIIKHGSGECEICGKRGIQLVVDHNHNNGEFRGVLCRKCNVLLGLASDDIKLLSKSILYLAEKSI